MRCNIIRLERSPISLIPDLRQQQANFMFASNVRIISTDRAITTELTFPLYIHPLRYASFHGERRK